MPAFNVSLLPSVLLSSHLLVEVKAFPLSSKTKVNAERRADCFTSTVEREVWSSPTGKLRSSPLDSKDEVPFLSKKSV